MSAVMAMRHLWLRPQTLLVLLALGGLCSIVARVAYVGHGGLDHFIGAGASDVVHSLRLRGAVAAVALAAVAASSFGFGLFESQLNADAALLPSLARRARALCLSCVALIGVGSAVLTFAMDAGVPAPSAFAVGVVVASAVLWAIDPCRRGLQPAGVFAVLLTPLAAPALFALADDAPLAAAALSACAAGALALGQWRRKAVLDRAVDPRCTSMWRAAGVESKPGRGLPANWVARSEFQGRAGDALANGIRAALHEQSGMVRGGFAGQSMLIAAVLVSMLVLSTVIGDWVSGRGMETGLRHLLAVLEGGAWQPELGAARIPANFVLVPIWCATFTALLPIGLEGLIDYPLSRARRAEIAWRVSGLRLAAANGGLALGFVAVLLGVRAWLGAPLPSGVLPAVVLDVAAVAALAPVAWGLRLRFLAPPRRTSAVGRLTVIASATALLMVAATAAQREWVHVDSAGEWFAAAAAWAAALVLSQVFWRAFLRRHFARADLG